MSKALQDQWLEELLGHPVMRRANNAGTKAAPAPNSNGAAGAPADDDAAPVAARSSHANANSPPPNQAAVTVDEGEPTVIEQSGEAYNHEALGTITTGAAEGCLYAFLNEDGSAWAGSKFAPLAETLNKKGKIVQDTLVAMADRMFDWRKKMDVIRKNASGGQAGFKNAKAESATVGAHASGQAGEYLRNAIETYLDKTHTMEIEFRKVHEALLQYDHDYAEMDKALQQGAQLDATRQVQEDKEKAEEEKKKVDEERNQIGEYFDTALKLLKPDGWREVISDTAASLGKQFLEGTLVSTEHLAQLEKNLEASKKRLAHIEDRVQMDNVRAASAALEKASSAIGTARQSLTEAIRKVRDAQVTVVEALKKSPATKQTAEVIAKREALAKDVPEAQKLLGIYLARTAELVKDMTALKKNYTGFMEVQLSANKNNSIPSNPPYRYALSEIGRINAGTLGEFLTYIGEQREKADEEVKFLASPGNYFGGYASIPDVLQAALENRLKT